MGKKNTSAGRSWLMLALIAAIFFSFYRMNPDRPKERELTQHDFFEELKAGNIDEPIVRFINLDDGQTYLCGEMKNPEFASTQATEGQVTEGKPPPQKIRYKVPLVKGENEQLMVKLQEMGKNVKLEEQSSPLSPMVVNILVTIGIFAFFYWMLMRRMNGAGGPLNFGKSKAKLLNGTEVKKRITFADVAGIDEAREEVQEIVEFLKKPSEFTKLGGRIPKGVLLVGPPGTGKTLLAKAIAGEAEVPFFAMSGSDFEEIFVGVGASRMRDMFAEAKKRAPCIIFIDEIDSIGQKRTGAGAIGGSHAYEQTLNSMLVEMDGFEANEGVIVIAATNRPDTLDSALLRPGRFDRQVNVELPTLKGREEILKLHSKKIKFAEGTDISRVARGTPGFSGADLANLLNEAALLATRKGLAGVDEATLDEARDKVLWGRERKSAGYSQRDREITAWHEAGHAILQLKLKSSDPLHKVTIIPRGRALGVTMSLPKNDVLNRTRSYYLDMLVICCGGRIAEEMFTNDLSTGAAQDIEQATSIARKMICVYGMSEKYGFQAFMEPSSLNSGDLPPRFSEETSREIDGEVTKMLKDAYAKAKSILEENRDKLELLAKTLLEKETMDGRDVEALINGKTETEETADTPCCNG